jgi:hypothetical protein
VAWSLQFLGYLRTLSLKFQKARTKTCWLSQLNWDCQQGRDRKTSILVLSFWNFKLKVLKYQWNFRPHAHISKFGETPNYYIYNIENKSKSQQQASGQNTGWVELVRVLYWLCEGALQRTSKDFPRAYPPLAWRLGSLLVLELSLSAVGSISSLF